MPQRTSTARWTGAFYLGLGISALVSFAFVRSALFVPTDAAATLANLDAHAGSPAWALRST